MTARDDYPLINAATGTTHFDRQAQAALDEIDRLRNALIDHMAEYHRPVTVSVYARHTGAANEP